MIFRSTSKKPVLLVGNGVRSADACDLIYEIADQTKIPVLTTMNAIDLVQDSIKIGFIGTYGNRVANIILNNCDFLISVGARLGLRQTGNPLMNFAPNAKLVRVDVDQYELSRNIKSNETKFLMDAKIFLKELLLENIPEYTEWNRRCISLKKFLDSFDKTAGNLVIEKINTVLPHNAIVAVDVGQNQCWSAQSLHLRGRKGRIFINGGYGSMGCALPVAIGASISIDKGIVFCVTGDGGLQMNIQELETIVRENLPVKIIVINNECLGKISEIQKKSYDERYSQTTKSSGYSVPNFEKISSAYGIKSTTLVSYEKLSDYSSWFIDNEPCLVDIRIPEDTLLIPKVQWKAGKILPDLESSIETQIQKILNQ